MQAVNTHRLSDIVVDDVSVEWRDWSGNVWEIGSTPFVLEGPALETHQGDNSAHGVG